MTINDARLGFSSSSSSQWSNLIALVNEQAFQTSFLVNECNITLTWEFHLVNRFFKSTSALYNLYHFVYFILTYNSHRGSFVKLLKLKSFFVNDTPRRSCKARAPDGHSLEKRNLKLWRQSPWKFLSVWRFETKFSVRNRLSSSILWRGIGKGASFFFLSFIKLIKLFVKSVYCS